MKALLVTAAALASTLGACAAPGDGPAPGRPSSEHEATAVTLALGEATQLTEPGGYVDPAWLPRGDGVSYGGPRYASLHVVPPAGDPPRELALPAGATAFRHEWLDGPDRLVLRGLAEAPRIELSLAGVVLHSSQPPGPRVFIRRGDVVIDGDDGEERLTRGEDRFLDPVLSADGSLLAVVGQRTGVHVIDVATRRPLRHGGPGSHPAWGPAGRWLLFERSEDDGEHVTASDLYALALDSGDVVPLTATAHALEGHPAVSPDGGRLAFIRDGALWVAPLLEVRP